MSRQSTLQTLGQLIAPAKLVRAGGRDLPILSMTMHGGLVDQAAKFKKRVASADTSSYKVVSRSQLVVGFPIDEGVLSVQDLYDAAIVSPAYDVWEIHRDRVLPEYLERFLRSPRALSYYAQKLRGTTARRRTLPDDLFLALSVPMPTLDEQRRIADILDKADAIRRKRKEAIALTEELLRSAFLDMFGDPVRNPKGWRRDTLGNLLRLKSGDFLPAKQMESSGPFAVYGGNGINGRHSSYLFEEPAITIGRVGVYCGVVHRTEPKSWVTDNALYVASFSDELDSIYLEHALRLADLNQYASQAAQPLISSGRLYPVEIVCPSKEAQARFAGFVSSQTATRSLVRQAEGDSNRLFGSLVARAFSGQLDAAGVSC